MDLVKTDISEKAPTAGEAVKDYVDRAYTAIKKAKSEAQPIYQALKDKSKEAREKAKEAVKDYATDFVQGLPDLAHAKAKGTAEKAAQALVKLPDLATKRIMDRILGKQKL